MFERPDIAALTVIGWGALAYNTFIQQSLGFVCWLAALHRLPASVAAIGTLFVPIVGVLASAYVLGEPLGPAQIAALVSHRRRRHPRGAVMSGKISATGLMFLLGTSIGWGLNWPIMKYVLAQWPPLSARGWTGRRRRAGAGALRGRDAAPASGCRAISGCGSVVFAFLNVTLWMAVMGYALVYPAGERSHRDRLHHPLWTALLAWPLLGERMTLTRVDRADDGVRRIDVLLLGGNEMSATMAKLPGVVLALIGAIGFALGTIFLKKWPHAAARRDLGGLADRHRLPAAWRSRA